MWPYLLQNVDRVPTALQAGGEAGSRGGIVILSCFREKLGHRYLIRHPSAGNRPEDDGNNSSESLNHEKIKWQNGIT